MVKLSKTEQHKKLRLETNECKKCLLHKSRNKVVFFRGSIKAKLMFIGESPGRDENIKGKPFIGVAGKLLNEMIEKASINQKEIYICNINCCMPENAPRGKPTQKQIRICSKRLKRQISIVDPKVIVTLGGMSTSSLLKRNIYITKIRGSHIKLKIGGKKRIIVPTYHPSYLARNRSTNKKDIRWQMLKNLFIRDLKEAYKEAYK